MSATSPFSPSRLASGPESTAARLDDETSSGHPPTSAPRAARDEESGHRAAPLFVIINLGAGRPEDEDTCATIQRVLTEAGRVHEMLRVEDPADLQKVAERAVEQARRCGGVVVASGGDGTLNTVAQATLGSGCPFGVIPRGTFNYFGRAHGIPSDAEAATRMLLDASPRPVQVGLVNDRVFLVNASLGLYPKSLEDREAQSRRLGRSRWVAGWAALVTVWKGVRPLDLTLEHEGRGRRVRALTLFVGNNRLQLDQVGVHDAAAVHDGKLVAIIVRPRPAWTLLWLLVKGALGSLADSEAVEHFALDELIVKPARLQRHRRRLKLATDGEVDRIETPVRFRAAPDALMLLTPDVATSGVERD